MLSYIRGRMFIAEETVNMFFASDIFYPYGGQKQFEVVCKYFSIKMCLVMMEAYSRPIIIEPQII